MAGGAGGGPASCPKNVCWSLVLVDPGAPGRGRAARSARRCSGTGSRRRARRRGSCSWAGSAAGPDRDRSAAAPRRSSVSPVGRRLGGQPGEQPRQVPGPGPRPCRSSAGRSRRPRREWSTPVYSATRSSASARLRDSTGSTPETSSSWAFTLTSSRDPVSSTTALAPKIGMSGGSGRNRTWWCPARAGPARPPRPGRAPVPAAPARPSTASPGGRRAAAVGRGRTGPRPRRW